MSDVRPRHRVEYALTVALGAFLRNAPYRVALAVGWALAWFGHHVLRYRVRAAKTRIRQVFPEIPDRAVDRIAWRSWRDFMFNGVEMFRLPDIDDAWIARHVVNRAEVETTIRNLRESGQGAVVASPHMGASEAAGVVMQKMGAPVFMLTGRQSNPLTDAYINRLRGATGIPTVQKGSSLLRSVIRRLRSGDVLTFLADLRVAPNGVVVRFLDRDASVAPGMALFARQAGVPIVPIVVTREGWTRHRMTFHEPVPPDPDADKTADQARMTQAVFDVMTRAVRARPEQWFWYNKSWILDPVEPAPE